jgi:CTP:molybdopterin cytidylyltransferase MocA
LKGVIFLFRKQQKICGLILAAGLSSRMEDFKPLMSLNGRTLIENAVSSVLDGGARSVVVVTGYRGIELKALLQSCYGDQVIIAENHNYAMTDMMHSIKIGCQALPSCDAFFLLPGDMPLVGQSTFHKLLVARPKEKVSVVFPTLGGYRKHPVLIDVRLIPDILAFEDNGGLRQLWKKHEELIRTVPVEDKGVWIDLDTQNDYQVCKLAYERL